MLIIKLNLDLRQLRFLTSLYFKYCSLLFEQCVPNNKKNNTIAFKNIKYFLYNDIIDCFMNNYILA